MNLCETIESVVVSGQSHSSIKISHKAQTSIEFEFRIFEFLNLKPSSQLGLGLRCLAFCSRVRYQFGIVSVSSRTKSGGGGVAGQWRVAEGGGVGDNLMAVPHCV